MQMTWQHLPYSATPGNLRNKYTTNEVWLVALAEQLILPRFLSEVHDHILCRDTSHGRTFE